jgi:hypothetical protein
MWMWHPKYINLWGQKHCNICKLQSCRCQLVNYSFRSNRLYSFLGQYFLLFLSQHVFVQERAFCRSVGGGTASASSSLPRTDCLLPAAAVTTATASPCQTPWSNRLEGIYRLKWQKAGRLYVHMWSRHESGSMEVSCGGTGMKCSPP